MYGIFTYIWVISNANVGKYSIHGAYGYHTILQICKKVGVFLGLTKNKTTKIIYKDNYVPTKGRMQRLFNQQKKGIKKKTQHRQLVRKTSASPTSTCRTERSACFSRYDFCTTAMDQGGSMVSVVSIWSSIPWEFHDLMTNRPTPPDRYLSQLLIIPLRILTLTTFLLLVWQKNTTIITRYTKRVRP